MTRTDEIDAAPFAATAAGGIMKRLFLLLGLIGFAAPVAGQEEPALKALATVAETRKVADQAMAFVKQEKFEEAYGAVKAFWPLPAVEIDGLANQMKTQWPMVQQRFGKSLATEFINERRVGQSFIRYTYLQKFERHAIRWTFSFYRPADGWVVNAVSWDDGVSELYE